MHWQRISCNSKSLQLVGTLNGGQSFRWSFDAKTEEWTGIFSSTVWKIVQQKDFLLFKVLGSLQKCDSCRYSSDIVKHISHYGGNRKQSKTEKESDKCVCNNNFENKLKSYFRLDFDLDKHYNDWSKNDSYFLEASQQFYGIRMLAQDPVENIFSFICSQNNHISRISGMIDKLCETFGEKICQVDNVPYFAFPAVESMTKPEVEKQLRELKFGYRAKFIQQSASKIVKMGGARWLQELVEKPYVEAKAELIKLPGIGPKVADCICLMSLQHLEAVPVDTHVYQIAAQNYLPHLRGKKNVTDSMYKEIGDHFRELYGPYAGWAHTVLFCADLKKFQKEKSDGKPKTKRRKCN